MTKRMMHIGFDDTDSTRKGCTTYIAALLVEELSKLDVEFIDYPNLIRLNPNAPWKTRGNGALCLRFRYDKKREEKIKETVIARVEELSDLQSDCTDPGIVFLGKEHIPKEIKDFARRTITSIVTLKEALKLLTEHGGEAVGFKNGQGIIGSLAAVGETLPEDHTYEILAYRTPAYYGLKRQVEESSIWEMDRATSPYTFNNADAEKARVIITPRGPDPILLGIRGETPEIVKEAFEIVVPLEPVERWAIFRTNQGTDAHLRRAKSLNHLEPYNSVVVRGVVSSDPKVIPRRHIIFSIADENGQVDCAAYEPTGALCHAARNLAVGDELDVYGGVRPSSEKRPLTINLEKMHICKLATKTVCRNPFCSVCGKRLKSMGRNQGFRCEHCGRRHPKARKLEIEEKRALKLGLYMTSTRSQRHLTKPFSRYGREKQTKTLRMIERWHSP